MSRPPRTERLARDWLPVMDKLFPADALRHQQAIRRAVDPSGRLHPDAAIGIIPRLQSSVWWISGVLAVGNSQGQDWLPANDGVANLLIANLRTAPTGSVTFRFRRSPSGSTVGTITIGVGGLSGSAVVSQPLTAGEIIRFDVTATDGIAAGVSAYLIYEAATGA